MSLFPPNTSSPSSVIIAADMTNARSILVYQDNLDKITVLNDRCLMGLAGPNSDIVSFGSYISRNLALQSYSYPTTPLSVPAVASFVRGELASAIRKGPFQANIMLGGVDVTSSKVDGNDVKGVETNLYFIDYMGAQASVSYGAQGYCGSFLLSVFDRKYKEGMTKDEGMELVKDCVNELKTRFLLSQRKFMVKMVDENGISVLHEGEMAQ